MGFDHNGCEVVATGAFHGFFDQAFGGIDAGEVRGRREDDFLDAGVPEPVGDAVGAENESIAGFEGDGKDLRFYRIWVTADGALELMFVGAVPCFAFVEFAIAAHSADGGVVFGELDHATCFGKVVDATIAYVTEVECVGSEPTDAECGTHSAAFIVSPCCFPCLFVNTLYKKRQ